MTKISCTLFIYFLTFITVNAQMSSIVNEKEKKRYIISGIKAGYFYLNSLTEKGDSFYYKNNKSAHNQLKADSVNVLKIYDLCLFRRIEHYSFADSFNLYFYWNLDEPKIIYFKKSNGLNEAFASTHPIKPRSHKVEPISSVIWSPEIQFYLNWEENKNCFLTQEFSEWLIVRDNCIYIIKDGKLNKFSEYIKAHPSQFPIDKLTRAFLGFRKELYPAP